MKNYAAKFFKIALLAILIVTLVAIFVACNGNKDKNDNNNENSALTDSALFSDNSLDAYMGWCINNSAGMAIMKYTDYTLENGENIGQLMIIGFETNDYEFGTTNGYTVAFLVCESESAVKKLYEENKNDELFYYSTQTQNYLIQETKKGVFQNEICNSKIPESYSGSDVLMQLMKEAYTGIINNTEKVDDIEFYYGYNNQEDYFYCHDMRAEYKQDKYWAYFNSNRSEHYSDREWLEEEYQSLKTNYTNDSYINLKEDNGYYSARLIERPDRYVYEDYTYNNDGLAIEGISITDYICTKNSSNTLVVPATIDNSAVLAVSLERLNANTVELSEGILSAKMSNCLNLETLILPKSLKKLDSNPILGCSSLKTIKYAGTKAEWEELVINNDPNNWYISEYGDFYTNTHHYNYITFTVECKDETITYSHKD